MSISLPIWRHLSTLPSCPRTLPGDRVKPLASDAEMARRILIAEDVRDVPADGEIVVPPDAVVTERAREVAQERGIRIRISEAGAKERSSRQRR